MGTLDKAILEGLKSMKICRYVPSSSSLPNLAVSLDTVGSYVLELEVNEKRGYSSVTLREVPLFLIEAFNALRERGMNVEGLFRKEGNCARIKNVMPVYMGCTSIPVECTTHDICSMIKRFFRELKTPLFANLQNKLVMIASENEGEERLHKLLDVVRMLPAGHLGTLGFLVRQLKYFGDRHEAHHMTVDNLARVFAPTLFRDDGPPLAVRKKKKGSQEHLFSTIRSDNDIKITILKDLIENAWQVGLPKDYYLASRRPSDRDKARTLRNNDEVGPSYLRSSSARPLSRSSFPNVVQTSGSHIERNERKAEKRFSAKPAEDAKLRRGRRSSSTVRELFSTFSNKVLRRGNSPSRGYARRSSADCGSSLTTRKSDQSCVEPVPVGDKTPKAGPSGVLRSASDDTENVSRLDLDIENEQILDKTLVEERSENHLDGSSSKILHSQRSGGTPARHRSRRESPRKHLNINARVKPAGNSPPKTNASWMPASPALEPAEMATKRISESTVQRKESGEKRLLDGKILKKNSMKKKGNAVPQAIKNDTSASFLEEYMRETGRVKERHRRHTTPVKTCSFLKRNQPNTLASGLKAPQVQMRDRRSTTLGFRINAADDIRPAEKKRRSESLGNDSSGVSPDSDEENNTSITAAQTVDISSILEQKNMESRQRRAKRQKRKKEAKLAMSTQQCSSTGSPSVSLLDDVTNEIERLERERRAACKMEKSAQLLVSPKEDKAKAVEVPVNEVIHVVPAVPSSMPPVSDGPSAIEQPSPKDVNAAVMTTSTPASHTKSKAVQTTGAPNRVVHAPIATTAQTSTRFIIHSSGNRPNVPSEINNPSAASYLTRTGFSKTQNRQPYFEVQQDVAVDESEFARSEFYKKEILCRSKENVSLLSAGFSKRKVCAEADFLYSLRGL